MINCTSFDYINLLTKAADASWKRETVISNNIANVNTPGYKRKDLNFQGVLTEELGRCKHESLDSKVSDVDLSRLDPQIYVDSANYSYRMDGNNVDIDTENVELASEQIRYEGLIDCINSEFERMKAVIS
ncbi:MAG: flagellar basal body rod protein FlgB [Lachnobacterium sp.]|nr:flagellar basal body rod protein FlgB [Lachnobacterium sp.]